MRRALRRLLERLGVPVVGHEVKPLLVARFADDPGGAADAGRLRHPDRGLHPQRGAAQPDDRRRRRRAARPDPAAGRRARHRRTGRPRSPRCDRRPRTARTSAGRGRARPPVPRDRAAADRRCSPGWRRPASPSTARRWPCSTEFGAEIARLEAEIYVDVGHEFNLGSPKQLEQILFFELNLPKGKRTKTGYSTDASVLEDLRAAHPMIDKLLEWRIYTKLRSTYVEALPTPDRGGRAAPHDLPPGRRRHRPPVVVRPEPPEHPDPDAARPADPARVRGRRARSHPGRGRLQPDRAAHPRPRLGRRAPARRVRAQGRHPPRDGGPRAPQGARRRHRGRAIDGQDGQLRAGLRDERLRAVEPREHPARRGPGVHQHLLRDLFRDQLLHARDQGAGSDPGLRHDAARAQAPDPRAGRPQPDAARRRASGWPSTCRSRARPPTS